ncbi:MAG: response regulator, partial [Thermoanaerobaculia bacterium]|nr:response regulator [Thermoanaerobaculia bacterium]
NRLRAAARPAPRGGTETILLVEDDAAVRELAREVLEQRGYRVLEASSGAEALRAWPAVRDQVALVLTDLVMPDGVSGHELAERLRAERARLAVVFTSGYSAELAGRELALPGGEAFLQKPFSSNTLLETVRRCLDG